MFSQMVSYEFLLHGALHGYFCTSSALPLKNPQSVANLKKAICVVRSDSIIDHGSHSIIFLLFEFKSVR